jgi:hypothetical protein
LHQGLDTLSQKDQCFVKRQHFVSCAHFLNRLPKSTYSGRFGLRPHLTLKVGVALMLKGKDVYREMPFCIEK